MARVRSTARVIHDGEEAKGAETAPISEVMKRSGLAVPEEASEGTPAAEAEQIDVEEGETEDEYNAMPSKPSHLEFGKSTISEGDMPKLIKLGYISEAKNKLVRFSGEEITPKPGKDELTPNAIVRLSIYIWALRSQGWNCLPKVSAGHMSFIIRQKLEKMGCTRISAATILLIAKMRSLQLLAIVPNGPPTGRPSGFMLRLTRRRRSWFRAHWS
jgi:hypothetical protein